MVPIMAQEDGSGNGYMHCDRVGKLGWGVKKGEERKKGGKEQFLEGRRRRRRRRSNNRWCTAPGWTNLRPDQINNGRE